MACPDPYPPLTSYDRLDLLNQVKQYYLRFGYNVTILRTRARPNGEIYRVVLACDRGGRHKPSQSRGIRNAKSNKTGCQWSGSLMLTGDGWMHIPGHLSHNHPPPVSHEPLDSAKARAEARKRASDRVRVRTLLPDLFLGAWPPGPKNSLTDVPGVLVSTQSLHPTRSVNTGVTCILPRKEWFTDACHAGLFRFNGAGEMTGSHWIAETGLLNSPIVITNSLSVGDAYRGVYEHALKNHTTEDGELEAFMIPVVAETFDGYLSDISKMSVKPSDIVRGIDMATDEPVKEGNTGGGTGMICHHWKGGTGSASRVLPGRGTDEEEKSYTVGVLVQANYGKAPHLRIGGAPVGRILLHQQEQEQLQFQEHQRLHQEQQQQQPHHSSSSDHRVEEGDEDVDVDEEEDAAADARAAEEAQLQHQVFAQYRNWQANVAAHKERKDGSIITVVATDAPLTPTQCERLAKRAAVGLSRVGGYGHNPSGDLFLAFSTGNRVPVQTLAMDGPAGFDAYRARALKIEIVDDATVNGLIEAAADATEEAIYNALCMADSMDGFKGRKVEALPLQKLKEIMQKYL
ncbi:hypothetical protein ACHAQA_003115 [Verticillium albo-atrum]